MGFSREFYDHLVEAYALLISEEVTVVVELDDGPNLVEVVRGKLGALSWRAETVSFKVPDGTPDTFITRWTVYNADWIPIFEQDVSDTRVTGGQPVNLTLDSWIDIPVPRSRLDREQQFTETGDF